MLPATACAPYFSRAYYGPPPEHASTSQTSQSQTPTQSWWMSVADTVCSLWRRFVSRSENPTQRVEANKKQNEDDKRCFVAYTSSKKKAPTAKVQAPQDKPSGEEQVDATSHRVYLECDNEFVLANQDSSDQNPTQALLFCAEHGASTPQNQEPKRVVEAFWTHPVLHQFGLNSDVKKRRFCFIKNLDAAEQQTRLVCEIFPKRLGKNPHGAYKDLREGQLWKINLKDRLVIPYQSPAGTSTAHCAVLKNRADRTIEESHILTEIAMMQQIGEGNDEKKGIVPYLGSCSYVSRDRREKCAFFMPHYPQGSLCNMPHNISAQYARMQLDLLCGLETMHKKGIVHRDIKPDNIFLDTASDGAMTARLADLGFAQSLQDLCKTRKDLFANTPLYMAPEHARFYQDCQKASSKAEKTAFLSEKSDEEIKAYVAKNDVWSLGLVLYEWSHEKKLLNYLEDNTTSILDLTTDERKKGELSKLKAKLTYFSKQGDLIDQNGENLFPEPTDKQSYKHVVWQMLRPCPEHRLSAEQARLKWQACFLQQNPSCAPQFSKDKNNVAAVGSGCERLASPLRLEVPAVKPADGSLEGSSLPAPSPELMTNEGIA